MALIQHRIGHILHVERGRVPEHDAQYQNGDHQDLPKGLVLPDGQQFLAADAAHLLTE